jgi:uncharacterized membrane protein
MLKSLKIAGVLLVVGTCLSFSLDGNTAVVSQQTSTNLFQTSLKEKAYIVLQNKCNDCHRKKNKSVIFTRENMVQKAPKIQKQVFVKKKMPKDDVTLTTQERKDLELWLNSLNK